MKVSIVVPIYNVQGYLEKCLESLLSQTYKDLEIILVDDGSTDNCPMICDQYALKDDRIKVIHKENGGLVSARKAGTRVASGDYIINVDGDDWIESDRIQHLVEEGVSTNADMIYMAGMYREYADKSICCKTDISFRSYYKEEIIKELFPLFTDINRGFKLLLRGNLWMWAIKKSLLQEIQEVIDDRITIAEDLICVWMCLLSAESVAVIDESGYHYVQERIDAYTYFPNGKYRKNIKIWYHQLNDFLKLHQHYKEIKQIWISMVVIYFLLFDYNLLLGEETEYLYPFSKVKKGSKIAIYGAGKLGCNMIQTLMNVEGYEIVRWVDKEVKISPFSEFKIEKIETLKNEDYDYIILAIMDCDLVEKIKENLIKMGINKEKIAEIDLRVIDENVLCNI